MIHVLAFGIKPVFFLAMYFCGVGYFVRFLKNLVLHNPVSILYCHRVIDSTQPQYEFLKASGHLTVENFEKRIAYLSRRFTFISPKDFALYKIDPRRPKNLVMLTFDDGYKCFFTNVFPLLKKYNIHALLFLAVDSIEQRTLLWYDEVIYLVNLSREEGFRIPQLSIRYFRLTTMQDKLESCGYILEELKKMSPACRNAIIGSLYATLGVTKKDIDSLEIMLKWPEIKEMLDSGLVTIGSHTSSHPILTTVSTEQLTHEIVDSKRMLESKLGVVVNCFAYPNGRLIDFNQQAIDLLKISGYKFAFTTTEFQPDDNNFSIARYGMIDEPFMRFVLRICGLFEIRSMIFRRSRIAWLYKVGSVKYDTMLVHPKVNAWMLNYVGSSGKRIARSIAGMARPPKHVFLCVCDHFEPLRDHSSYSSGLKRVSKWVEAFPAIAKRYCDADGCCPKYTFFYPEEEYRKEYLDLLAGLKQSGLAEVEVHLHHDNDTDPHLRRMLLDYKNLLHEHHGLLSVDKKTGMVSYGFIHGNWTLDNSGNRGELCGVNNEIDILRETGCYADFTMPSAPHYTQTFKINSIYYAKDDPARPKSHNWGRDAEVNRRGDGLLMIDGPLKLNWINRKWLIFPHIENGCVSFDYPLNEQRIALWLRSGIVVRGADDCLFIKLYTHGCVDETMNYLLTSGLDYLFRSFESKARQGGFRLHYVTAREMANLVFALEQGKGLAAVQDRKNERFV